MNHSAGNALFAAFGQLTNHCHETAFYVVDAEGVVRAWNSGCERLFGFRESEMLGTKPDALYAPVEGELNPLPSGRPSSAELVSETEVQHLRRDGTRFRATVLSTPLFNSGGQVEGWLREVRNPTAHPARPERGCEQLPDELLEWVSDGVARLDAFGRVQYANSRLAELLGLPAPQLKECSFIGLFGEGLARQLRPLLQRCEAEGRAEGELWFVGLDGAPIQAAIVLLRSAAADRPSGEMVVILTPRLAPCGSARRPAALQPGAPADGEDPALRSAADRRHRAQYEVSRVLVENASVQETRENLLRVICESLGWACADLWVLDEVDHSLRCAALWQRRDERLAPFTRATRELRLMPGVGAVGTVWTQAAPQWGETSSPKFHRSEAAHAAGLRSLLVFPVTFVGHVQGVIGLYSESLRDPEPMLLETLDGIGRQLGEFTLRKQSEEALARSEEQLRQAQKMEAIGTLAGGVAHDFNNMLAVISGYSELILLDEGLDENTRTAVDQIRSAADRAAGLTRQLLAFSRKQLLQPRRLDLVTLTYDLGRLLQRLIGEDIELITLGGPQPSMVLADPSQLEQVLMNLVVNARDAMPQGGRLTLEVRNMTLDARDMQRHLEAAPGEYVMLAVSDTGCGMDRSTVARVFEPFFTTKEPGRGTGLGLATVYGIVKQTGGEIWVYSEPGAGTTFKVFLPRADVDPSATAAQDRSPVFGSGTVLLVEDEDLLRALVREVLTASGYTVLEATDGADALRLAAEHSGEISLVLTDVVMPQMSGQELSERLRMLRPGVKVLFMSGYTDDAVVRHGVQAAEVAFIQKPFSPHQLTRKVQEVIRGTAAV